MVKSKKKRSPRKSPKKNNSPLKEMKEVEIAPKKKEPIPDPKQVSSSSESEDEVMSEADAPLKMDDEKADNSSKQEATRGYSRLFSPYRTMGIVSHGPFQLMPNQNSSNATICSAIGERFHLLQCDKLQPVLVSQAVPAGQGDSGPQVITQVVSDNSLSISLVAHGTRAAPKHVTLFHRTQPIDTLAVCESKGWTIVDLLSLGRIKVAMKGEKEGKMENAALCAVVMSRGKPVPDDGVPVLGDDDDSDSDSESDDSESDDDSDSDDDQCRGQVALVVLTRESLSLYKRIELTKFETFCPRTAIHPPTYVNKIIIGGSCAKSSKDAMILLNVKSGKIIHIFKCLSNDNIKSEISTLESSPAIDTIAVGTTKGYVHLVNTRRDKLLFSLRHKMKAGKSVKITSMSFRTDGSALQYGIAPLAVGRSDGTITVWDLTPNEDEDSQSMGRTLLCEMEKVHYPGGVHKLQYMPQEPLLLSTGTNSNSILMHIFDSPDHSGRILRQRKGHTSSPKYIRYLHPGAGAGGGVMVNAGDGTDASACEILSSGGADRTLRKFSTARSVLDKEFSQGRGLEKRARELGMSSKSELLLPPVSAMITSEARSRDWGDLVTIHHKHSFAYVWSSKRGAQSGPILRQDGWNVSAMKVQPPKETHATSIAMSTCGNFALVGTQGGRIYKYNVQSGHARGAFPPNLNKKEEKRRKEAGDIRRTFKALESKMHFANRKSNADKEDQDKIETEKIERRRAAKLKTASHTGFAVTGIAVDAVNRTVISVGADAKLIMWNFRTHAPHKKSPYELPAPATKLCHVRDSDLAAIALEDYSTLLFDCSSLSIVRRFGFGTSAARHDGPISDIGFSPDGRTLYTSSLDGTIRVWDVPTNSCVDWIGFSSAPTSLTVSPTGEFLATTHTGKLGISLWSDRSFYQTVHVDGTRKIDKPARMDDPAPIAEVEDGEDGLVGSDGHEFEEESTKKQEVEESMKGPALPKEKGLITLCGLPPAHWKNLFHLELVKERNKPTEPPKKPPTAPFFLQWRAGINNTGEEPTKKVEMADPENQSDGEWDAVWSDDDEGNHGGAIAADVAKKSDIDAASKRERELEDIDPSKTKRRKVTHYRSHLAALLEECGNKKVKGRQFQAVTEHMGTLGPSAIDVALSTLCSGMHDLENGLPLLILACRWFVEACQSRERFDAVNAYLHRFLHLHSGVLAGIEDNSYDQNTADTEQKRGDKEQREELISCLKLLSTAQNEAAEMLKGKMQNTLCLLRHFSRMV